MGPAGAVVIGLSAGVTGYFNDHAKTVWCDDSLGVFGHGVGGMLGLLMAGIFCSPSLGLFSGNGFSDGIDGIGGQRFVNGYCGNLCLHRRDQLDLCVL